MGHLNHGYIICT
uniref:Aminophospholipid ATPase n=1 Tax=Arundo donax TaxID=35708 RepID=A0A0A8YK53_ARUDO